jgi:hypothetical protein
MKPMNGSKPAARELIDRIMASERLQGSSHFSERVYASEPILTTGRQMANYLPDRYREMKAISRLETNSNGGGRWLSEAELFYRQGTFMADFEDDCPYPGTFNSYFPTYNAMSDRQLRGYFTWRAAVRQGDVKESCLSFAYVYLYELICGIGVTDPMDGFQKLESFWRAYRVFSPKIDRYARTWLQDYVVYHGLSPQLLEPYKTLSFDRALVALTRAEELACARLANPQRGRRKKGSSALPLPGDPVAEQRLFDALDALSTYHLAESRLYKSKPEALRHVCCAVFVRMSEYYRRQRKYSLTESLFGGQFELAYTMFGSAVFFEPERHPDADYELDEIHRYRCRNGAWFCERYQGNRSRNAKLGQAMRATDRILREGLGFDRPLKEQGKLPKYLQGLIEEEVAAWLAWSAAHAPVHVEIDLSQLANIRRAAASTRESLLIDEEREGAGALLDAADGDTRDGESDDVTHVDRTAPEPLPMAAAAASPVEPISPPAATAAAGYTHQTAGLVPSEVGYLRALLEKDRAGAAKIAKENRSSEDMLVDAINEALFDLVGDTVIEYGPNGLELIEDYREDVEGFLNHE